MGYAFAKRVSLMKSSAIREILKVTESPGVISFAGGLPAPELFPLNEMRMVFSEALDSGDGSVLQYSTTEGYPPLRRYISSAMGQKGIAAGEDQILLTNGSQQALDLLARIFIDPGDAVLVESPSYLGALQVFAGYQARLVAVPSDEGGMVVESLERAIKENSPKLIYLTPTFSNPTGIAMAADRRRKVAELLEKYRIPLIEDDPYGELRYLGKPVPPVKAFDRCGLIIYTSTFSKTIAPGLRLGWIAAEPEVISKLVLAKQGADLHTGTLVQRAVHRYLTSCDVGAHIERIRSEYRRRRNAMINAMEKLFPGEVKWTRPEGGMFLWVTLPPHLDSFSLLKEAVLQKVAFVPGTPFFPDEGGHNYMRLNFSNAKPSQIEEGIERLGRLLSRFHVRS
ncbi:MAG: PLP-dependent aminotransferase family protein [Bacillota bacterium]